MNEFDIFIALDGHGLNGFEGFAGVTRLRCAPDENRHDVEVKFFDGLAGGHGAPQSAAAPPRAGRQAEPRARGEQEGRARRQDDGRAR